MIDSTFVKMFMLILEQFLLFLNENIDHSIHFCSFTPLGCLLVHLLGPILLQGNDESLWSGKRYKLETPKSELQVRITV